ncbi:type I inositol 1,4,5-trisphosphate 5-phosphatase [Platysternon megacephalum]|uniref:BLOC-1-related complex subunit 7 n=1 Tax=Platysternon megacephalum TaxID=55544 RepID=A0A4D9EGS4_9SAUR|nr:type I inositol 1,4,5-trisphosphate 5-phosphatase [Platysternon megacephalum]
MAAAPAGSAADAQARFGRSVKGLLIDRVTGCGTDVIALTKQVLKGSRSSELLGHAARNMVMQEDAILHSEDSLRKMAIITTHLQYQQEAIQKKCHITTTTFPVDEGGLDSLQTPSPMFLTQPWHHCKAPQAASLPGVNVLPLPRKPVLRAGISSVCSGV